MTANQRMLDEFCISAIVEIWMLIVFKHKDRMKVIWIMHLINETEIVTSN